MEDDQSDKDSGLILILCDEKLERLYALQFCEIAEDHPLDFRFVSDPKLFMLLCLQNAPAAGLVDLAALIRGKTEDMNKLFAIRSVWPVLRSRIGSDGSAEVMRMSPPLKGPFQEAIIDILEGGSAWENAIESRMYLRCPVTCRARLRVAGSDDEWSRVNITDVSRGGCLVVASAPPLQGHGSRSRFAIYRGVAPFWRRRSSGPVHGRTALTSRSVGCNLSRNPSPKYFTMRWAIPPSRNFCSQTPSYCLNRECGSRPDSPPRARWVRTSCIHRAR